MKLYHNEHLQAQVHVACLFRFPHSTATQGDSMPGWQRLNSGILLALSAGRVKGYFRLWQRFATASHRHLLKTRQWTNTPNKMKSFQNTNTWIWSEYKPWVWRLYCSIPGWTTPPMASRVTWSTWLRTPPNSSWITSSTTSEYYSCFCHKIDRISSCSCLHLNLLRYVFSVYKGVRLVSAMNVLRSSCLQVTC